MKIITNNFLFSELLTMEDCVCHRIKKWNKKGNCNFLITCTIQAFVLAILNLYPTILTFSLKILREETELWDVINWEL